MLLALFCRRWAIDVIAVEPTVVDVALTAVLLELLTVLLLLVVVVADDVGCISSNLNWNQTRKKNIFNLNKLWFRLGGC